MASPFKRDNLRNQKQDFICQVASGLFNKKGFDATSLDEVAAQLAISKPSIYYYYTNKSELLLGCYNRTLDICEGILEDARAMPGSGLDKVCAFTEQLIILHCSSGNVAVVNEIDALPDHEVNTIRKRSHALTRSLESFVELGVQDGSIQPLLVPIVTRFMMGSVNWMPKWHREDGKYTPEEIAASYIALLKNGISQ